MTRRDTSSSSDLLAEVARGEADRCAPAFSEVLHRRVMRAVESTPRPSHADQNVRSAWRLIVPLAAAAAIVVMLMPLWRTAPVPGRVPVSSVLPRPAPSQAAPVPQLPSLGGALASLTRRESAIEADLGRGRWAGLDHDARVAVHYVLDPLAIKPLDAPPPVQ